MCDGGKSPQSPISRELTPAAVINLRLERDRSPYPLLSTLVLAWSRISDTIEGENTSEREGNDMKIGIIAGTDSTTPTLKDLVALAQKVEAKGLDNIWMANIFSFDAISALSVMGYETSKIGLGTAVTPSYPRHPTAIAQQALTANAAAGGRFILGVGLSHKIVIEDMLGFSYDKPARHMREYLSVLMPLVRGETVNFNGEQYRVNGVTFDVPGSENMPVVIAGLGPVMLKLAGEMADGTTTWMVGPKTMESHIAPSVRKAASDAGRPDPKIVCGLPIVLTSDPDGARQKIGEALTIYGQLPSYRAMLDKEGAAGPADVAIAGDEAHLRAEISRLADMGVTHFSAALSDVEEGATDRTLDLLASL